MEASVVRKLRKSDDTPDFVAFRTSLSPQLTSNLSPSLQNSSPLLYTFDFDFLTSTMTSLFNPMDAGIYDNQSYLFAQAASTPLEGARVKASLDNVAFSMQNLSLSIHSSSEGLRSSLGGEMEKLSGALSETKGILEAKSVGELNDLSSSSSHQIGLTSVSIVRDRLDNRCVNKEAPQINDKNRSKLQNDRGIDFNPLRQSHRIDGRDQELFTRTSCQGTTQGEENRPTRIEITTKGK